MSNKRDFLLAVLGSLHSGDQLLHPELLFNPWDWALRTAALACMVALLWCSLFDPGAQADKWIQGFCMMLAWGIGLEATEFISIGAPRALQRSRMQWQLWR